MRALARGRVRRLPRAQRLHLRAERVDHRVGVPPLRRQPLALLLRPLEQRVPLGHRRRERWPMRPRAGHHMRQRRTADDDLALPQRPVVR